jgi:hypothetical protein
LRASYALNINVGVLLSYEGLHRSSKGARVHFSGKNRTVTDGPFAETKELVAGFLILQVKSLEEAIEWIKLSPNGHAGESEVEIRQVFEPEDFAPAFSEEGIQQEKKSALNWQIVQQRNSPTCTDAMPV